MQCSRRDLSPAFAYVVPKQCSNHAVTSAQCFASIKDVVTAVDVQMVTDGRIESSQNGLLQLFETAMSCEAKHA